MNAIQDGSHKIVFSVLVDQQFEAGQLDNAYKNMLISLIKPSTEAASELARMGVSVTAQGR